MLETIYSDIKTLIVAMFLFGVAYVCFGIAIKYEDYQWRREHNDLAKRD